jgi:hypothetical protein
VAGDSGLAIARRIFLEVQETKMSKYVLLYSGGGMPQSEGEQQQVMKAWDAWFSKLGKAVVDQGDPFSQNAKSVSADGSIKNGPVDGMASGYSIIEADSLDAAVKMAKECPVLQGGAKISVFETFHVM